MSNAKKIAAELVTRAQACYPKALEVDHRDPIAYLDGAPYDAVAVRVALADMADYRERLTSAPAWLSFGFIASEYGQKTWVIMAKTH